MIFLWKPLILLSTLVAPGTWAKLSAGHLSAGIFSTLHSSEPSVPPMNAHTGETLPPLNTTYYFDQLVDHTNPSLGTFKQRYWHTWEWYKPGDLDKAM